MRTTSYSASRSITASLPAARVAGTACGPALEAPAERRTLTSSPRNSGRVCGGRSMLRPNPVEQHYRDARCGATMLPWSVEVCLDRLGRAAIT